jgi:hypothetical protein
MERSRSHGQVIVNERNMQLRHSNGAASRMPRPTTIQLVEDVLR